MKKECFGYVPGRKDCQVMTENICEKRKCSFYKTKENYRRGLVGLPPIEDGERRKAGRHSKPVRCIENRRVFPSCGKAEQSMRLPHQSVWRVCRGIQESVSGYHFEYCDMEDDLL